MFYDGWNQSTSNLMNGKYEQKTSLKNQKNKTKIHANSGLA